jgi:hypothetical protein
VASANGTSSHISNVRTRSEAGSSSSAWLCP